jgi:nitrate reductase molybdenum cofactor assembly chaperone
LEYPDQSYAAKLERAAAERSAAAPFAAAARGLSTEELQELYVRTFELNPPTCLEVGWHLFGENYERGEFLVKMRQEMRRLGVPETTELPDHLTRVLPVMARMEPEEGALFSAEFLGRALEKMRAGLGDKENPYALLLDAVSLAVSTQEVVHD